MMNENRKISIVKGKEMVFFGKVLSKHDTYKTSTGQQLNALNATIAVSVITKTFPQQSTSQSAAVPTETEEEVNVLFFLSKKAFEAINVDESYKFTGPLRINSDTGFVHMSIYNAVKSDDFPNN